MKMNMNNIKMKGLIASLFMGLIFLFSCEKQDVGNPLDGVGSSYVRLDVLTTISNVIGYNVGVTAMDASPHTQTTFIIHRDAISNADLNSTVKVDFALDPTYLTTYNKDAQHVYDTAYVNDSTRTYHEVYDANMHFINASGKSVPITANNYDSLHAANPNTYDAATFADWQGEVTDFAIQEAGIQGTAYAESTAPIQYQVLPANVYSFVADGLSGNTLTFAPGETTKELSIKIDPSTLSFTTNYALPLTLANPSGIKISGDNPAGAVGQAAVQLINQIIVKNKYDGVYSMGGSMGRYTAAGGAPLNDGLDGPMTPGLTTNIVTAGANTVIFTMYWASGGGVGGVGNTASPRITVNADNSIVLDIVDGGATPANWGPIPGKPNNYDPTTQTFNINYHWGASSPNSPSGTTRAMYYQLKYKSPR
jgi:hypothetical protein